MEERNVIVRDNGGSTAAFSLIAVVVVVGLIGLFIWQPWNTAPETQPVTTPHTVKSQDR